MKRENLDRSQSFGSIFGILPYAFEQNGKFFNHVGLEVKEDGTWDETDGEVLTEDDAGDAPNYQEMPARDLNSLLKKRAGKGLRPGSTKDALVAALMKLDQDGD